jgi:hypothetical protein
MYLEVEVGSVDDQEQNGSPARDDQKPSFVIVLLLDIKVKLYK